MRAGLPAQDPRRDRPVAAAQSGIALVVVLWVVTLLTVIASSFVYSARSNIQITANLAGRVRAQALAEAGVQRGLHELLKPATDGERWKAEGRPYAFDLGEGKITVTLVDESTFIDLNAAPENLLLGLLLSTGMEEGEAQGLLDKIEDWRDGDDLARAAGAEKDEYEAAGLRYGPANADFHTVEDLKSVLGMTPQIYERIAGALTVHTATPGINSALAPRQVLLAVPGVTAEEVDAYLQLRAEALAAGASPPPFPQAVAFSAARAGIVYNLRSQAALSDGTVFVREAVAKLTGDSRRPFGFLDWREGRP